MTDQDRLSHVRWLLERSDRLRGFYIVRAYNVLMADAVLIAVVVFLLDKGVPVVKGWQRFAFAAGMTVAVCFMVLSIVAAIRGSSNLVGRSRSLTQYRGPSRVFLN